MSAGGASQVQAKWVLLGFAAIFAVAATAVVFISNDVDRKAAKARELEEKLGRQVGPEDSPRHQKKLKDRKFAE